VRPTELNPIIRLNRARDARECALARWGLRAVVGEGSQCSAPRCINARAESLATASAFRGAYEARRCLVPASAFYEWSGAKGKTHQVARRPEGRTAVCARRAVGWWKDRGRDDPPVHSYPIVTPMRTQR